MKNIHRMSMLSIVLLVSFSHLQASDWVKTQVYGVWQSVPAMPTLPKSDTAASQLSVSKNFDAAQKQVKDTWNSASPEVKTATKIGGVVLAGALVCKGLHCGYSMLRNAVVRSVTEEVKSTIAQDTAAAKVAIDTHTQEYIQKLESNQSELVNAHSSLLHNAQNTLQVIQDAHKKALTDISTDYHKAICQHSTMLAQETEKHKQALKNAKLSHLSTQAKKLTQDNKEDQ